MGIVIIAIGALSLRFIHSSIKKSEYRLTELVDEYNLYLLTQTRNPPGKIIDAKIANPVLKEGETTERLKGKELDYRSTGGNITLKLPSIKRGKFE